MLFLVFSALFSLRTENKLADIMTKEIPLPTFQLLLSKIGIKNILSILRASITKYILPLHWFVGKKTCPLTQMTQEIYIGQNHIYIVLKCTLIEICWWRRVLHQHPRKCIFALWTWTLVHSTIEILLCQGLGESKIEMMSYEIAKWPLTWKPKKT